MPQPSSTELALAAAIQIANAHTAAKALLANDFSARITSWCAEIVFVRRQGPMTLHQAYRSLMDRMVSRACGIDLLMLTAAYAELLVHGRPSEQDQAIDAEGYDNDESSRP